MSRLSAYRADDLLRRTDGLTDTDYEAELTDAGRRGTRGRAPGGRR